ncbi:beta-hydroxyacyl-ACP dehydratase [Pelagicoccus enzymogenes]|uniref:3-hydroxyacyl-ACP dehydratase FabZ family protein n=1 Tax=Pelagicoccus enzymogenes TaxID=2773457 RepID=UPI00280C68E6|nr:3-hydroxyacyl-ACP dehydratase FabZ family protein [Pelagicoccus enzymogenes]MDQ8198480.1 beta-hydroxyacyl-ACP dehydratase [Pelagicoccus enzymogenes]
MATEEVLNAIPHRPPFLFVDEVVEASENSLTARRHVPDTESFFEGHYPNNPIMPGVIISEAVFQTGAIYMSRLFADKIKDDPSLVPVLSKIENARFKSIVRPNDTLLITVKYKESVGAFSFLDGSVQTEDGRKVMTVSFCVALASAKA